MKKMLIFILVGLICLGYTSRVLAADLLIRALLPAPETGEEWIDIENTTNASVSGQLYKVRDIYGSIKTYTISQSFAPHEIKRLLASQTQISLNNTADAVELLLSNTSVASSSAYENAPTGQVWVNRSGVWSFILLEDYISRLTIRDWSLDSEDEDEPLSSPKPSSTVKSTPQPTGGVSLPLLKRPQPSSTFQYGVPRLLPVVPATASGQVENIWPSEPPLPDEEKEVAAYLRWKRQALFGSLSLVFTGFCFLSIVGMRLKRLLYLRDPWNATFAHLLPSDP